MTRWNLHLICEKNREKTITQTTKTYSLTMLDVFIWQQIERKTYSFVREQITTIFLA